MCRIQTRPRSYAEEPLLGFKSKTDTVTLSLRELIRRRRIEELKEMLGAVNLDIDIPASRRPPPSTQVIFVDTLVRVAAFRSRPGQEAHHLPARDNRRPVLPVRLT